MSLTARGQTPLGKVILRYCEHRKTIDRLRPDSMRGYRITLTDFSNTVGPLPIGGITRRHVHRYMAAKTASGVSDGTLGLYVSRLRTFSEWCAAERYCDDFMFAIHGPRRRKAVPRALPAEDVRRALSAASTQRDKTILALMVYGGLRVGEVSRLRRCDLDLDAGMMLVHGKGGHQRELPIVNGLHAELVRLFLERQPAASDYVIRSLVNDRTPLATNTITVLVSRLLYAAGVKLGPNDGRSCHAFRHSCATHMLDFGADLRDVKDTLGHARLSTTADVYANRAQSPRLREAMEGRSY